jgi:uncharacterized glyoxalase superfamily protein PhnB
MTNSSAAAGTPAPQVWPSLQARDARALIDFYVTTFGFVATAVYADGDLVAHAQLDWPEGGGLMLGSHRPDAAWSRSPGTFGAYVVTADPEALWERVRDAEGVTVVRPLAPVDYGGSEFAVADPEGNYWSFGSYPGAPRS